MSKCRSWKISWSPRGNVVEFPFLKTTNQAFDMVRLAPCIIRNCLLFFPVSFAKYEVTTLGFTVSNDPKLRSVKCFGDSRINLQKWIGKNCPDTTKPQEKNRFSQVENTSWLSTPQSLPPAETKDVVYATWLRDNGACNNLGFFKRIISFATWRVLEKKEKDCPI